MPYRPRSHAERVARPAKNLRRAHPFYKTARWQKLRSWVLAGDPLCSDPFGTHRRDGVTVAATEVHHIVERRVDPGLALDPQNLDTLCKSCHSRITARERHGDS